MLDLLTRAKNAIETYNSQLRINSANIANMSTPGYKTMKISFQTIFEKLINGGTAASDSMGGTNPIQFGSSVGIGSIGLDFSQGTVSEGQPLDLAINGTGLFTVSPDDGTTRLYTRAGKFKVDSAGNLVTDNGMLVFGFSSGSLTPITGLTEYNSTLLSWTNDGQLAEFTDNTFSTVNRYTGYSIALTSFTNLSGLAQAQGSTYAASEASGEALTHESAGGTFGSIVARNYEQSNVFYTGEIIDSMEAQRAMSGNLTIVRMINDEITNFINRIS
jgi:flagellar hook protein FlgE